MKKLTLRSQIVLTTFLIAVIAISLLSLLIIRQVRADLHSMLEDELKALSGILCESISTSLVQNDSTYVRNIALSTLKAKDLQSVIIYDKNKNIIFKTMLNPELRIFLNNRDLALNQNLSHIDDYCILSDPIYYQNELIGYMNLTISHNSIHQSLSSNVNHILAASIFVLLSILLISNLLARLIVKPIRTFESLASQVASGNLNTNIDTRVLHKDFYNLGTAFNNMRVELIKAFSELENSRDNLEEEIKARNEVQQKLVKAFNELEHTRDNLENEVALRTKELSDELKIRKQAQEALKESEERFRELTNLLPATVFEINPEGDFTYSNKFGYKFSGYNEEDVKKGLSAFDLFLPEDRRRLRRFIIKSFRGIPSEDNEYTLVEKNGRKHSVMIYTSAIIRNGQSIGVRGLVFDITDRKKAEEELLKSKQRLALHAQQTPLAYIEWNKEMRVLEWNKSAEKIFGYSKKEALNKTADELIVPDFIKNKFDLVVEDLLEQKGGFRSTNENITKNGDIILCEWYNTPLIEDGRTIGIASLAHDITKRVHAEQEQIKLNEKLEKAERMESLGILAGGVAHDLNNMLGPLVAYPEMILEDLEPNSPIRADIEIMGKAAEQSAGVIQDLLTLARRGRYEMKPVDMNLIITEYIESAGYLKLSKSKPEIKTHVNLDRSVSKVMGSSSHLSKVIMNLVINAYDAMPNGGELYISTSQKHISSLIGGHEQIDRGEYLLLRIKDTGMGIDNESLDKIFEPYFSKKTMGGSSGSGLGLSVVYGVVKDHKGYYDIISKPQKGTEFIIYLPLADKELFVENTQKLKTVRGHEKILVVDDTKQQRDLAKRILESLGYEAVTVENGSTAVEYIKKNAVDLVLLDMIMENNYDGLETYKDILKINPNQRAIIVSGFSATERVETTLLMGAGAYIKKPYTKKTLSEAVRNELDKRIKTIV